jgi:hypothetical protein
LKNKKKKKKNKLRFRFRVIVFSGGQLYWWRKLEYQENSIDPSVVWFMVLSATFNNISVISWQSVLLVEEKIL